MYIVEISPGKYHRVEEYYIGHNRTYYQRDSTTTDWNKAKTFFFKFFARRKVRSLGVCVYSRHQPRSYK